MIYETSGRAREYFELAANLYSNCEHGCVYCFGPQVLKMNRGAFVQRGTPRKNAIKQLARDAERLSRRGETRHILLSFVTDPYQPADVYYKLTRQAIETLHSSRLNVALLTKAGILARRDFDLLELDDLFGQTLTFIDARRSVVWEPNAAVPEERMFNLKEAFLRGIGTWVSCEPVIDPMETLACISATADYVQHYKVGVTNYPKRIPQDLRPAVERIDWKNFAQNVVILLDRLGKSYYIKKDLARFLGHPEGISVGAFPK